MAPNRSAGSWGGRGSPVSVADVVEPVEEAPSAPELLGVVDEAPVDGSPLLPSPVEATGGAEPGQAVSAASRASEGASR